MGILAPFKYVPPLGVFLGGSSIILAKGSKTKNREQFYSFDIKIYEQSQKHYQKNDVADWIHPKEQDSVEAAKTWADKQDNAIRLLLIDGDQS